MCGTTLSGQDRRPDFSFGQVGYARLSPLFENPGYSEPRAVPHCSEKRRRARVVKALPRRTEKLPPFFEAPAPGSQFFSLLNESPSQTRKSLMPQSLPDSL